MSCNFHSHSSTPLFLLLFLNLCSALIAGDNTSTATSISDDANYLLQFKSSLPNPDILSDWTASSLNPCLFTGVTCTSSLSGSTRVTALDLTAIPISTTFPIIATSLLSLSSLQSLTLSSTNISGSLFPPPLQTCPPSLSHIDLSRNSLTASLPQLSSFFSSCPSVSTLNLSSNSILSGPTNWRFSHLPTLQTLDLSENHLTGRSILQRIIAGAVNLTHLSLRQNQLDGELSLENCGKLVYLDVSFNKFTSTPAPGDCSTLQHLDLSSNNFDGIIHDRFTGCHNLRYLNISNNAFSGPIPDLPTSVNLQFLYLSSNNFQDNLQHTQLSDACPSLLELDLSSNNLTGTIPTSFQLCSSLQILDISRNNLTGELPTDIFLKMTALKKLSVAFNYFTGELPDSISSLTGHLEILDLSANRISGRIPSSICATSTTTTTSLTELYMSDNLLTGSVPPNIGNCTQLVSLDLSFNHLTGTLPSTLGSLSNLKDLIMWMNNLEGSIPSELTYIQTLENLILDYNILTGTIPFGLRNCTNLNWISLSSNQLTGVIPSSIGELVNLSILKLSNNSLYGPIPPELGDCRSLLWIDLNNNQINGTIPPTLGNQSGKLAVGLVVGKKYVYLRNDGSKECHGAGDLFEFSGIRDTTMNKIPSRRTCNFTRIYRGNTLPTFQHNGTVMFLDLSYNLLEGEIPKELGSMYDLQILNLAHNGLSGPIPVEMGGMKSVGVMDLSYNRLSGEIPKSLGSLTLLTEINLSNNKLSGQIPATSQFDSFPPDRFYNNSGLCGYPLIECKDLKGSSNGGGDEDRQRKWRQGMVAGFVGLGLLLSLLCVSVFMIVFVKVKRRGQEEGTGLDGGGGGGKGNSNSGSTNTGWKLTGAREAMSINLATFDKPLRKLTFADLVEATNGFHHDCLVGSGGFGDVYMARLKDGITVAIKKLIHVSGQGEKEFMAEMETIGRIKHRNLVPMLGYCKVGEERLLVYEYMKYGSLDEVLRNPKKVGVTPLNWEKRRKIAIGAARGLAFLHHNCTPHVIHRDMKSSNVLLDENLEAKVSDFGMARLVGVMDTHLSVSSLAGTPGYVPPEYYQSFQCSTKGDVYSYGVVLLELLTGKKPTNSVDFGDDNLVGWVKRHAKMKISDVFDPVLMKEDYPGGLEVELLEYLKVACACLNDRPWKRPTMIQVMAMFKEIRTGSGVDSRGADGIERSFRNVDGRRGGGVDMSMEEIPEGSNL